MYRQNVSVKLKKVVLFMWLSISEICFSFTDPSREPQ